MLEKQYKYRVLVLLSTYNGEKYLEQQIESILQQEDCSVSLLVRDDGSTDYTCDILKKYQEKRKLLWYDGENLQSAKSFMHLLMHAERDYEFYSFADQDDVWEKNKLSTAIHKIGICNIPTIWCSNSKLVDENLNFVGSYVNGFVPKYSLIGIITGGGIQGATMVFNHALASYFWDRKMPAKITMHDYYVSAVCLAIGGDIIYDKNSYMLYRQHGKNVLGLKKGLLSTLNNRISIILNRDGMFDIALVAKEIIDEYKDNILIEEEKILRLISRYHKNIFTRAKLAKNTGIGNGRCNIGIALRLAILFGKL